MGVIKKIDIILLISIILICLFGVMMIYTSSYVWAEYKFNDPYRYMKMQGMFLIIGLIIMAIVTNIDYTWYLKKANIILGVCFLLLILVLIPGIGSVRNGSRSWFGIGSLGIQPSEFMKLAIIIFTSKYLANNRKWIKYIGKGVMPILVILILIFGLIMLQPDFGTGVVIVMTIVVMLFVSGVDLSFFVKIGMLGMVGAVGLIIMAPYRVKRIISFLNPWSDPLGSGFQIIQSLYAIGPGELL